LRRINQCNLLDFTDKNTVRQFIQENDIRDIADLNAMLKQISGVFIEQLLEAERDEHLGKDTSKRLSRRLMPEMGIPRKQFVRLMAK